MSTQGHRFGLKSQEKYVGIEFYSSNECMTIE